MKLMCIKNNREFGYHNLTIGKKYHVYTLSMNTKICTVINDIGRMYSYSTDFFITLEEYRDKRLKEIGI